MRAAPSDAGSGVHPGPSSAADLVVEIRRRPRMASDGVRSAWALVFTALAAAVFGFTLHQQRPGSLWSLETVVTVYFGAWGVYSTVYPLLTWIAFRSADGRTLQAWLTENQATRRRRRISEWLVATGGPSGAVSFCLFAMGAVGAATVLPELRSSPLVVGLAAVVVATSWVLIATVFGLHYARENSRLRELRFPATGDPQPPSFADYWYVAVQVSASYGGCDVEVTGPGLRKAVTAHALVSLVFNSVLVALLVSLFISATT